MVYLGNLGPFDDAIGVMGGSLDDADGTTW